MIGYKRKSERKWEKYLSISGWEDSFFGGYTRIINDYPELKLSQNISVTPSEGFKLGWYSSNKLLKIFIYLVGKRNKMSSLLNGCVETMEDDKTYIVIDRNAIASCVDSLVNLNNELSSLFRNYRQELIDSTIKIDVTSEDGSSEDDLEGDQEKKKDDQQEDGESDQENDGDSDSDQDGDGEDQENDSDGKSKESKKDQKSETTTKKLQKARRAIQDTKEYKSFYTTALSLTDNIKEPVFKHLSSRAPTSYSYDDIAIANKIISKLDISFDTDSDRLNSLKQGKLDTGKLAEFVGGNDHIYFRVEENMITKPFAVTILCDESGSMSGSKIHNQYRIVKILYKVFSEILPPDKLEVYAHTTDDSFIQPIIRIYQDAYNNSFDDRIDNMYSNQLSENYDYEVIQKIYNTIRAKSTEAMLFIVISDGRPCGGFGIELKMKQLIEKCRRDNFVTVGLGFGRDSRYVEDIYNYSYVIYNYNTMVERITTLLNKVVKTEFQ